MTEQPAAPIYAREAYLAELERDYKGTANWLLNSYKQSLPIIKKHIKDFEISLHQKNNKDGVITASDVYGMQTYKRLAATIEAEIALLANSMEAAATDLSEKAVKTGVQAALPLTLATVTGGVGAVITDIWNAPDPEALHRLMLNSSYSKYYDGVEAMAGNAVDDFNAVVISLVAQGRNPRFIANAVNKWLMVPYSWAENNIRTAQIDAYRRANHATFLNNDDVLNGWRWSATLDGRVCMSCVVRHGTIYSLTERLRDHHRGRCAPIPLVKGAKWHKNSVKGVDWFQALPEQQQKAVMKNNAMWRAWKDGAVLLDEMSQSYDDPVYGKMYSQASLKNILGIKGASKYYKTPKLPPLKAPTTKPPAQPVKSKFTPSAMLTAQKQAKVDKLLKQVQFSDKGAAHGVEIVAKAKAKYLSDPTYDNWEYWKMASEQTAQAMETNLLAKAELAQFAQQENLQQYKQQATPTWSWNDVTKYKDIPPFTVGGKTTPDAPPLLAPEVAYDPATPADAGMVPFNPAEPANGYQGLDDVKSADYDGVLRFWGEPDDIAAAGEAWGRYVEQNHPEWVEAIAHFTGSGSSNLNERLREGRPLRDAELNMIERMDAAFQTAPKLNRVTWRGIVEYDDRGSQVYESVEDRFNRMRARIGEVQNWLGYSSLSLDPRVSGDFSRSRYEDSQPGFIYEVHSNRGNYINDISVYQDEEYEAVLPRESKLRVVDVRIQEREFTDKEKSFVKGETKVRQVIVVVEDVTQ